MCWNTDFKPSKGPSDSFVTDEFIPTNISHRLQQQQQQKAKFLTRVIFFFVCKKFFFSSFWFVLLLKICEISLFWAPDVVAHLGHNFHIYRIFSHRKINREEKKRAAHKTEWKKSFKRTDILHSLEKSLARNLFQDQLKIVSDII